MSVQEQMQTARAHIQAGKYDKARAILRSIDHPKAREWLAKLPAPARQRSPLLGYIIHTNSPI